MAFPIPLLLLAGGAAALFALTKTTPSTRTVTLDPNLPPQIASEVQNQMLTQKNPGVLLAMAEALAPKYPQTAYQLRYQAWVLQGSQGTPPAAPAPGAPGLPGSLGTVTCAMLDKLIDQPTCTAVINALMTSNDPAALSGFAATIAQKYPVAAALLNGKAQLIQEVQSLPPLQLPPLPGIPGIPGQPPQPQGPPAPPQPGGPPMPPTPVPAGKPQECALYDNGLTAAQCTQITQQLTNDQDPASLMAFAATYAAFPVAYGMLKGKADFLSGLGGGGLPGIPGFPGQPPQPAPAGQPTYTLADSTTYTGANAGRPKPSVMIVTGSRPNVANANSPASIAHVATGNQASMMMLAALNPQLTLGAGPKMMGGAVGQAVNVPWAWAPALAQAGYDVRQDDGAGPNVVATAGLEIVGAVGTMPTIVDQRPPNDLEGVGRQLGGIPEIVGGVSGLPTRPDIVGVTASRPMPSYFVKMRATDRVFPMKLAKIGAKTTTPAGDSAAYEHLKQLNPHLVTKAGLWLQVKPNDEVNIPPDWVAPLKVKFQVFKDQGVS